MGSTVEGRRQRSGQRAIARLVLSLFAAGFVAALLAGPSAHATSRTPGLGLPAQTCPPPTNPYGSSTTIADCTTTTTAAPATVTLTISYKSGTVRWRACVSEPARGSAVQLYINGTFADTSQVTSDKCTPNNDLSLCLQPGTYNATAVDQPYGQGSATFGVNKSGCNNPATLSGTAPLNGTGGSATRHAGGLAFTGANISLLVIAAAALMTVGVAIVKMTRQRRIAG